MSVIRPYLVILLLAVLMLQTVGFVSASPPPVRPGDVITTQPDKDGGANHPTDGEIFWSDGVLPGGSSLFNHENNPDTLIPGGPGTRLIVIFRGGKLDSDICRVFGGFKGVFPNPNCAAE